MEKNLLLSFLSRINPRDGKISSKLYQIPKREIETTNEAAIFYLSQENIALDRIFLFTTESVKGKITGLNADKEYTHIEYFKERIKSDIDDIENKIEISDFNEKGDANTALTDVINMAKKLQRYQAEHKEDSITLHLDFTGGMRHANMIMLALTKIAEYTGIEIGKILYSDYGRGVVEEMDNIYHLFDIISGAEEFVKFGSVSTIMKYVQRDESSDKLSKMLDAMSDFARNIKLCRSDNFLLTLKQLQARIKKFNNYYETSSNLNQNDELMGVLLPTMERDYDIHLEENDDDYILDVIPWCLKKGYFQQALTLCAEEIPKYMFKKNFLSVKEECLEEVESLRKTQKNRSPFEYFVLYGFIFAKQHDDKFNLADWYSHQINNKQESEKSTFIEKCLRPMTIKILNGKETADSAIDKIESYMNQQTYITFKNIEKCYEFIYLINDFYIDADMAYELPEFEEIYNRLFLKYLKNNNLKSFDLTAEDKLNILRKVINSNASKKDFIDFIGKFSSNFGEKTRVSLDRYINLNIEKTTFRRIMDIYLKLKDSRNILNHASDEQPPADWVIEKYINEEMKELRKGKKEVKKSVTNS